MRRALFIADHATGTGHVVRSRALANELTERGWQVSSCSKRPPGFDGDVVIVDGNEFDEETYLWGCPVVAIQDKPFGHEWPRARVALHVHPTAGLIDARLGVEPLRLQGPGFSPLRREFSEVQWEPTSNVFDARELRDKSAAFVAVQMSQARVVVTYGGMRAMEAACVGAPMVILPRNPGEMSNASGFASILAAERVLDDSEIGPAVERLLGRPGRLAGMSRRGRAHVDGRGRERVADAIEEVGR